MLTNFVLRKAEGEVNLLHRPSLLPPGIGLIKELHKST